MSKPKYLKNYDVKDATHYLKCSHQIGGNYNYYSMPCTILSRTVAGSLKIVVFGDRNWANTGHHKKIRYVHPTRVFKKEDAVRA